MKIKKYFLLTILILLAVGLLYRGWFYRHLVTYKSIGKRTNYFAKDEKLTKYIDSSIQQLNEPDIEQLIKFGLLITSRKLNFSASNNEIDPNKLISSKTAHCVGYASFFTTTSNYLFQKYNIADKWIAKSKIGKLYFLGANIHKYFSSSFFKDHDFVTIENIVTGEIFAVDPTVNDYLGIDFVTYYE